MPDQLSRNAGAQPNSEMGVVGYALAAGVAVVLLPVLPFIAALWLPRKFAGGTRTRPRSSPTG